MSYPAFASDGLGAAYFQFFTWMLTLAFIISILIGVFYRITNKKNQTPLSHTATIMVKVFFTVILLVLIILAIGFL